jgi:tetratricopeptide (TPR) repeat protein
LRVALINAVLRKIHNDESIKEPLKKKVGDLTKRVNWLGLGKIALSSFLPLPSVASQVMDSLIKSFLKNPEDIPEKTQELIGDFEDEFKELVKEYVGDKGRLVVFIDDLDRCIPEKAIDVMEAIKLFLNVEGSVFIIGADKKVIENGILQKHGEKSGSWGRNYLDKIIQIPVNLPPLRKDIITEQFIFGLDVSKEIEKYADIIAEAGDNPRTIKRLLNRFEIQKILAEKKELKVESKVLAKLVVIEFRWHDFYTDLISIYSETGTNLIQISKEISKGTDIEGEKRLEEWKTFKKYFEDKRLMKFLLEDEPLLGDIDLDYYVYMGRSTAELRKSAENYFSIAYSFGEKGDYIKAIENYDMALELNPKCEYAWNNKGSALHDLGKYEEAITCYDKALELNPKCEYAWNNKGNLLQELGREEEAERCLFYGKNYAPE